MVGTDESSGRALDGVWMFGFLAPVLNKQGTLGTSASISSDIRQKRNNTSLPQLSRGLSDGRHYSSGKCNTGDCTSIPCAVPDTPECSRMM